MDYPLAILVIVFSHFGFIVRQTDRITHRDVAERLTPATVVGASK